MAAFDALMHLRHAVRRALATVCATLEHTALNERAAKTEREKVIRLGGFLNPLIVTDGDDYNVKWCVDFPSFRRAIVCILLRKHCNSTV